MGSTSIYWREKKPLACEEQLFSMDMSLIQIRWWGQCAIQYDTHTCYLQSTYSCAQTNSTEQSHSWKADSSSALHEIPRILWDSVVQNRIHNSSPLVLTLSQINPIHALPANFLKINFTIILPSTPRSSKWPLSVGFPHQNLVETSPLPHTCYMPHRSHSSWFGHSDIWRGV